MGAVIVCTQLYLVCETKVPRSAKLGDLDYYHSLIKLLLLSISGPFAYIGSALNGATRIARRSYRPGACIHNNRWTSKKQVELLLRRKGESCAGQCSTNIICCNSMGRTRLISLATCISRGHPRSNVTIIRPSLDSTEHLVAKDGLFTLKCHIKSERAVAAIHKIQGAFLIRTNARNPRKRNHQSTS